MFLIFSVSVLISLYQDLFTHYSKIPKPPIARNAVLSALPLELYYKDINLYEKLYAQFYVFYILFAQNTRDICSERVLHKIYLELENRGFTYNNLIYENFFYKHKSIYQVTMGEILNVLKIGQTEPLYISDFTALKRVGYKTSALIFNEFLDSDCWPVVDINVYRAYKTLEKEYNLKQVKTADELFFLLVELNNFCDTNIGFELARLLHTHRRSPQKMAVVKAHYCPICKVN